MKNFIRIIKYGRPYLGWLIFGFLLILVLAQSQLFMPLVQRFVIDDILSKTKEESIVIKWFNFEIDQDPVSWLIIVLITIIGFYIVVGLFSYVLTYVMNPKYSLGPPCEKYFKIIVEGEISLKFLNNFVSLDVIRDGNILRMVKCEIIEKIKSVKS